nr:ulp1 protease family, C-terminal catalytic domain-containing protein [Tanacetum cinerariifolium]
MFQLLKKDIQEGDELLKTVKEQKQMILDLQLRLNSVEEKLKPGPSDVDHLDKVTLSKNAPDCGLDQQSVGGVSQCMNVDEPYKSGEGVNQCTGLNDEYESVAVDGLISLWSQDVGHISKKSFVVDSPQFKVKDNEKAYISTQQVQDDVNVNSVVKEETVKDDVNVDSLVKEDIKKDDVNVDSLVKEDIEKDDVHVDGVVKDDEKIENETLPCQKFPGKAYLSLYIQPSSTEDVTCSLSAPKRTVTAPEEVNALFSDKNMIEMRWTFPWCVDGHLVYIDFWEKLVGRNHTKRGWLSTSHLDIWIDYLWQFREPNADWAMASPYLCDMLSWFQFLLYYADGVKYSVPWFANNVQNVYFSINEKDSPWVLGELHISSGLITIYDSLGGPPNGIETRLFWLDLREKLQFHILLFLDNVEVFEKNIAKDDYSISFQYADGVPIQGGLYGDCGLWVCIFLYRLSHNIPLEVDDRISFALAYRE